MNTASVVENVANVNGWSYRSDYSDRGMFGSTCVGIVGPDRMEMEDACRGAGITADLWYDNMGEQYIVYFPEITIQKGSLK